jgi:hypothetical protein
LWLLRLLSERRAGESPVAWLAQATAGGAVNVPVRATRWSSSRLASNDLVFAMLGPNI